MFAWPRQGKSMTSLTEIQNGIQKLYNSNDKNIWNMWFIKIKLTIMLNLGNNLLNT
jgi:hypothetical protein